ncbi:MAG: PUA domain-containing protein [Candidatus Alkanophagales archaeon]
MIDRHKSREELLRKVRTIADYQFGRGAGVALFDDDVEFLFSRKGRVAQVLKGGRRLVTVRANDGLMTLSPEGARRLLARFEPPRLRVVMSEESVPFVRSGRTAFAKHVIAADPEIRGGDEVILVDESDELLGTGRALLSAAEMLAFRHGAAVKVRYGVGDGEGGRPARSEDGA